jgi:cyanobactin maturation PatA/PatG family protease
MSIRNCLSVLGTGDERICMAILDGPVDHSHPCFRGAKLTQLQTLVRGDPGGHAFAHGTHVASIIFGQPRSPVEGVAPSCRGLIVPIFADEAPGEDLACSQLDLARAILLAVEDGAQVINISGGQLTPSGEPEPILAQAIESCRRHDVLIVAAAGNNGCECLHVPAAVPTVLAVGAMDGDGKPLMLSNWSAVYRDNGILAPGADVLGATPGGGTTRKSGTSFAAPFVSGLVGLVASEQVRRGQMPDTRAIGTALLKTATPCLPERNGDCRRFLAGRVNIQGVIELLARGDELDMISPLQNPAPVGEKSAPERSDIASPTAAQVTVADGENQVSGNRATLQEISTSPCRSQKLFVAQPTKNSTSISPSSRKARSAGPIQIATTSRCRSSIRGTIK